MSTSAEFRCRCGKVRGTVSNASPRVVNRVLCYCDDCQAFAHQLGRTDLLDAHGGSDIVQVAPACVRFVAGHDLIAGVRLTPNGLFRWHTSCCNTPVGNTLGPTVPFVGIMAQAFENPPQRPDDIFGRPIGAIMGKYAIGDAPPGSKGIRLSLLMRAIWTVVGWRLRGQSWPHPFFSRDTRQPIYPVTVLPPTEREALRQFCGPHPTASAEGRVTG